MSADTHFYTLHLSAVRRETEEAVSLVFEVPAELAETFQYTQGQYLTLRFKLKGKEVRRAYSLCSSPVADKELAVTVKRVNKGLVSNHINDNLKPGVQLEVMPPQGKFFTPLQAEQKKAYYLFGGGSGITPLLSILKTVLEVEPKSEVFLFYGNRDEDSIIFREELDKLQRRYSGQFYLEHILAEPKREKAGGLGGLFKKGNITWQGLVGMADGNAAAAFLDRHPRPDREAEYFICGPNAMMDSIEAALQARGVAKKQLHIERFTSEIPQGEAAASDGAVVQNATVVARVNGKTHEFSPQPKETILEAMRRLDLDPPYSCLSGACATCMAKVKVGSVKMDSCFALDDDEIKQGYILTCQARPTAQQVEIDFDFN